MSKTEIRSQFILATEDVNGRPVFFRYMKRGNGYNTINRAIQTYDFEQAKRWANYDTASDYALRTEFSNIAMSVWEIDESGCVWNPKGALMGVVAAR